MYMLNGCGTTLYGKTTIPGESAYIATKWICLLWLPIIPLGSYLVFSESGTNLIIWSDREYELARLDTLYKPHLKAYIWTGLAIIAFLALGYSNGGDQELSGKVQPRDQEIASTANEEGLKLASENKYPEAIASFNRAIEAYPSSAILWSNRGVTYAESGEYGKAIEDFTKAINLDPLLTTGYYYRGDAFTELNFLDSAIADYRMAINLDPKYAAAYYSLGLALYYVEDYNSSLEALNRCLELNYQPIDLYCDRGFVHLAMGRSTEALEDAKAVLALDGTYPGAHFLRALVLDRDGDRLGALQSYDSYLNYADSSRVDQIGFAKERVIELQR